MEAAFSFFSFIAIFATLRVITHRKPVYALLYLNISILSLACIFFLLGSSFAGSLEVIVYAGAIMVLFVFVVMMLNTNIDCNKKNFFVYKRIWMVIISVILLGLLIYVLIDIGQYSIIGEIITDKTIGMTLFGPYVLAVECASMLLLAGLIVAFHIGRDEYNKKVKVDECLFLKK